MKKFIFYLTATLTLLFLFIYCLHQKRFFVYHLASKADKLIESDFFYLQLKTIESGKDVVVSYLFEYKNDIENSTLPKYYLTLTDNVIEYLKPFEKVEKYPKIPKDYQPAQLSYNNNQCDVNIKLHGTWYGHDTLVPLSPHHKEAKKSYRIKITNEELHDVKEWSFIIPSDRFFVSSFFINQVYKKLGLPYPKSHFGILYINDVYQGIYHIEEDIDESKKYHSRNELKNHITLKTNCDSCLMFIPGKDNFKVLNFTTTISDPTLLKKIHNQLDSLIINMNDSTIEKYFDLDKTAKLLSTIYLRGDFGVHDIIERNLRLTYDINES
ncbi:MAG: CotH kinase family protein, partial [Bacteroidia bacterium]|nr:CotH kinase family protein [Bacteroidia bacterium]